MHTRHCFGMATMAILFLVLAAAPAGALVLHDNGPLVNSPGTGPGGADESLVQTSLGMSTFGYNAALNGGFRLAEDFEVSDAGGWSISQVTVYAYQTFSGTASTLDHINLQIWNGPPGDGGSAVIWGDTATDRLAASSWSNVYRRYQGSPGNTDRPVMKAIVHVGTHLAQGSYWLDWQIGGTLGSGPYAPPITVNGQTTTGNARQYNAASWNPITDIGTGTPQGLPFVLEGHTAACGLDYVAHDWDFTISDQGFSPVVCDPTGGGSAWEWGVSTIAGAPGTVWGTVLGGSYAQNTGHGLLSPPFLVTQVTDKMQLLQYVHTETNFDGCNVKVGDVVLEPYTPYGATISTSTSYYAYCVDNQPGWTGSSSSGPSQDWVEQCFDLSAFLGQTIQVEFDFGSDSSVTYPGWYLGYVRIGDDSPGPPPSYDFLVPFWQHGYGEQTFFSFYNAPGSTAAAAVDLQLLDETGGLSQSAPPAYVPPGRTYMPDTGVGGWYAAGDHYGGALARVTYDDLPVADLFSAWSAVYASLPSSQPGFTVPVPQSPLRPDTLDSGLRTGSGTVSIPAWEKRGSSVTFYSLWNAPGSMNSVDLTLTWCIPDGTAIGGTSLTLAPGEIGFVETLPPHIPLGNWGGVGTIEIDFGPSPDPADQVVLWSTIYGIFGGAQVGFPVPLELAEEPLRERVPEPAGSRQEFYRALSPFWQAGWDLNTVWTFYNAPASTSTVQIWIELHGSNGITLLDTSPTLTLAPGQGGHLDTVESWYGAGWQLGVASIWLRYAGAPAPVDEVAVWSAVYSDPQPGEARTGFTVSVPGAPLRPWNMTSETPAVAGGTRHGNGTVLVPFWQEGLGVHSFWSIWNSPSSNAFATVALRLRDAAGAQVEWYAVYLMPGQASMLDTQDTSWYGGGENYGVGELTITFDGPDDPANQVTAWEAVYGFHLGYQVGYPVELK